MNRFVPIALCMAVAVLEGFDIQAMGVAAPRLAPEFGLGAREMGWVFSINNIGMVLGAALGGWLADRVGRKPVFIGAVAMFGLFTLGVVVTRDFESLLAVRVLAGLGFGAALPNMMAIATELSDPVRRSSTAALIFCGFPIGGGTVALLTQVLPATLDWRALFIMGGLLPALLVPILFRFLPETLTPEVRGLQKVRAPVFKALFGEGRAVPSLLLWLTFLPTLLILYLILNWLPTLVVAKGLDKAIAPQASLAFNLGSVAGALLLGRLVDRFGPRWPMTLSYAALIGTLMMLGTASELAMIITLSGIAGFFLLGANYALYGVAPAYYPTAMRGTGSGASVAVGRVGSILGPAVAGVLLAGGTTATNLVQYLAPVAAVAGIAVFVLSFFRREH
jgi:MFS transporter, AAHS family, 3-hydroxyphenylpropionic acid transporter